MANLMLEGGGPMWFLAAFGIATLLFAALYARYPGRRRLETTLALAVATLATTCTCICADLAAVGHHAPKYLAEHPGATLPEVLLQGFAESMSPGILGFTVLSLAAVIVAFGLQRAPEP